MTFDDDFRWHNNGNGFVKLVTCVRDRRTKKKQNKQNRANASRAVSYLIYQQFTQSKKKDMVVLLVAHVHTYTHKQARFVPTNHRQHRTMRENVETVTVTRYIAVTFYKYVSSKAGQKRGGGTGKGGPDSQVILEEGQKLRFVVFARLQVTQRVALVRVDLQLVRFVGLDQSVHEL